MKNYPYYKENFGQWLLALGYSDSTTYYMPRMLNEFFTWLAGHGVQDIQHITEIHTANFIEYNNARANKRRGGGISISHVNKYIETITKFNQYLKNTTGLQIPLKTERLEQEISKPRIILTPAEIKSLYAVTDETHLGIRDRAMLAVYYGCGLRKKEGIQLDLDDVLLERKLLYVRQTKNNYERYTPITTANLKHIEQYIYNARPLLIGEKSKEQGLFIGSFGARLDAQVFYLRLKQLCKQAGIPKDIGVHNLRHSIATHLLQSGMELENIALFLGHRCLDSTQFYTQLLNETN
jgi:integrase/recombinase XerD